ncbi:MAG: chemotaxis response regulator protein-glutamate methylesterase [Rhodospirillales bacterium]|nr:chemotaxis response regulator protein-glutamate methylesterase [Rhodospirillales bacterium]
MVADDSAVVRGLITRMLESDPEVCVVASVSNGSLAVERLSRSRDMDVIVLDIEMPVMDGITALGKLIAIDPTIQVIMASTLTQHNAQISIRALDAGAADYLPKPSSRELVGAADFRRELLLKVKTLGGVRRRRLAPATSSTTPVASVSEVSRRVTRTPAVPTAAVAQTKLSLRPTVRNRPDVIAIGCSTGGPQALAAVLKSIKPGDFAQPLLITQHMPPTFTTILAEHLQRVSGLPCAEAKSGETLEGGRLYVAPGDFHMIVEGAPGNARLKLTREPPENFCRPSVDPMLRSLARCYGSRALAVILTGMGADGLAGSRQLVESGGNVVAQDQASSVVWGMPGAVASAGLCCAVEPLDRIAATMVALAKGAVVR